jgi:hypothetical protein
MLWVEVVFWSRMAAKKMYLMTTCRRVKFIQGKNPNEYIVIPSA